MSLGKRVEAERVLTAELLEALRHQAQTTTEFMERLGGQIINNVLDVFTATFATDGVITREYNVAAGSVEVCNDLNTNTVTVSSAPAGGGIAGSAPGGGTGVFKVKGGATRTVALASRTLSLYGTSGDTISVQVFTAAVRPGTV